MQPTKVTVDSSCHFLKLFGIFHIFIIPVFAKYMSVFYKKKRASFPFYCFVPSYLRTPTIWRFFSLSLSLCLVIFVKILSLSRFWGEVFILSWPEKGCSIYIPDGDLPSRTRTAKTLWFTNPRAPAPGGRPLSPMAPRGEWNRSAGRGGHAGTQDRDQPAPFAVGDIIGTLFFLFNMSGV